MKKESVELKIKYLAAWEYYSDDRRRLIRNLQTHGIDERGFEYFRRIQSALQFFTRGNFVEKCLEYYIDMEGNPTSELIKENFKLPITDWKEHRMFFLKKTEQGVHRVGGKKPASLMLPWHKVMKTPFQYISTIDCSDPLFSWMGIEFLHIVYPLYECSPYGIFLDYSNPNAPKILNPESFTGDWYDAKYMNLNDVEFFETRYMSVADIDPELCSYMSEKKELLLCGVPCWLQYPEVPICPKTKKTMRFICQLESDDSIILTNPESIGAYAFADKYLCFGDYGDLYLFFQPESRILHAKMQF